MHNCALALVKGNQATDPCQLSGGRGKGFFPEHGFDPSHSMDHFPAKTEQTINITFNSRSFVSAFI